MSEPHERRDSLERCLASGRATLAGAELKDILLLAFQVPDYKPPILPAAALELTSLSRKDNVSYDEVARVLERDPLLVASVLKIVQSPVYGGRVRVQSLRDALSRLGIKTLHDVVWQVLLGTRVFRAPAYAGMLEQLQRHGTFTAHAARIVAQQAGVPADYAFLCGLLHDVGWSGALVVATTDQLPVTSLDTLSLAIDKIHCEAGAIMAQQWELMPELIEVIGHHHDRSGTDRPGLVQVICIAEQLAEDFGFAIEGPHSDSTPRLGVDENLLGRYEQALGALGLETKIERIRQLVQDVADRLRAEAA